MIKSPPFSLLAILAFFQTGVSTTVADDAPGVVETDSAVSLIHIGSLDSYDVTQMGKVAAERVVAFLESKDPQEAKAAVGIYDRIIPDENFGGEYTALRWVLKVALSTEDEREKVHLADPFVRRFYDLLSDDDWKGLKSFMISKYHLGTGEEDRDDFITTQRQNRFFEDFILFNNPVRDSWEQSEKMIEMLDLQPGQNIVDIGSGPGFFAFKFAELVGDEGKVYAVETNDDHVGYLNKTIEAFEIKNVEVVKPRAEDLGFEDTVDVAYMCSLYHNMYAMFNNEEREAIVESIRKVLAEDGKLVVVDNGPVKGTLPYHGPYIRRELIIEQLKHFGFDLVQTEQFIPQRYCLVFKLREGAKELEISNADIPRTNIPEGGLIIDKIEDLPPTPGISRFADGDPNRIEVLSHRSLVRTLVRGVSPMYSNKGREAAEIFYDALLTMDREKLAETLEIYRDLLGTERVGDEYSAFIWFLEFILAPEAEKPGFITNDVVRNYFEFFAANGFKRMKIYLKNKYILAELEDELNELPLEGDPDERDPQKGREDDGGEGGGRGREAAYIKSRDANKDGKLGKDEVSASIWERIKSGDKDGDGFISADELLPPEGKSNSAEPDGGSGSKVEGNPAGSEGDEEDDRPQLPKPPEAGDPDASERELDLPLPPYEALSLDIDLNTIGAWWEYLVYSDPRREEWEQAERVVDFLELKPGDSIADVGSGAGFYTFKFAREVGDTGKVYALDLIKEQLDTLQAAGRRAGFENIVPIISKEDDTMLPENSIDVAYLCSLYHEVYVASMEYVKDDFVSSLKKAIKPGGKLVIVDNEPFPTRRGAYYGPHIAKELVITQMLNYGFKFKRFAQFIPQRYVLVFEVDE